MNEADFAAALDEVVVEGSMRLYDRLFRETVRSKVSDPYWKQALELFDSLSDAQRAVLLRIVRQVSIDAVSSTLSVLDGNKMLPGQSEPFTLLHGSTRLDNTLQDYFLAPHSGPNRT
jgi:hypothetical protein